MSSLLMEDVSFVLIKSSLWSQVRTNIEKFDFNLNKLTSSSSSAQLEIEWWDRAEIVDEVLWWRLKHMASKLP